MAYIWELRYTHHGAWMAILGLMLVSHLARREHASAMGFRKRNLSACLERFAPVLALMGLAMVAGGILFRTTREIPIEAGVAAWAAYLPWGLFQQYALNAYFLNRFDAALSPRSSVVLTAALFSGVHLPNWFLMMVTFAAGWCSARIYRRYRNLYFLGLAHATLGFLLFLVCPDSITHHLTVGRGWFTH